MLCPGPVVDDVISWEFKVEFKLRPSLAPSRDAAASSGDAPSLFCEMAERALRGLWTQDPTVGDVEWTSCSFVEKDLTVMTAYLRLLGEPARPAWVGDILARQLRPELATDQLRYVHVTPLSFRGDLVKHKVAYVQAFAGRGVPPAIPAARHQHAAGDTQHDPPSGSHAVSHAWTKIWRARCGRFETAWSTLHPDDPMALDYVTTVDTVRGLDYLRALRCRPTGEEGDEDEEDEEDEEEEEEDEDEEGGHGDSVIVFPMGRAPGVPGAPAAPPGGDERPLPPTDPQTQAAPPPPFALPFLLAAGAHFRPPSMGGGSRSEARREMSQRLDGVLRHLPPAVALEVECRRNNVARMSDDTAAKHTEWLDTLARLPLGVLSPPLLPPPGPGGVREEEEEDEEEEEGSEGSAEGVDSCCAASSPAGDALRRSAAALDAVTHGMQEVKRAVMHMVGQQVRAPGSRLRALGLKGPPGCGKTTLATEGIAPALGRPVHVINLGGAKDVHFLKGHNFTYQGARHGAVVDALLLAGTMDPVIVFDELDKVSDSAEGREITNVLMSLVDPAQNHAFKEIYLGNVPMDLSRALFVFTFNDASRVDPILLDRINVIPVDDLSREEKVDVVSRFILPRVARTFGLDAVLYDAAVMDATLEAVGATSRCGGGGGGGSGMRGLEKILEHAISCANLRALQGPTAPGAPGAPGRKRSRTGNGAAPVLVCDARPPRREAAGPPPPKRRRRMVVRLVDDDIRDALKGGDFAAGTLSRELLATMYT